MLVALVIFCCGNEATKVEIRREDRLTGTNPENCAQPVVNETFGQ
jgi:hypothetical protein